MPNHTLSKDDIQEAYLIIGQNVKRIRKSKGVSQLALSGAIGHKSVGIVSSAEIGINNKHFNIEHLIKISKYLDVEIEQFFEGI